MSPFARRKSAEKAWHSPSETRLSTLFDWFLHHVRTRPDAVALIAREEVDRGSLLRMTWCDLARCVAAGRQTLPPPVESRDAGSRCVAYRHRNHWHDVVLSLAVMARGGIEVPIDNRGEAEAVERLRERVGGDWIDDGFGKRFEAARLAMLRHSDEAVVSRLSTGFPTPLPHSPALVIWTSGTTAEPKGVLLSQQNLVGNAAAKLAAVPQSIEDVRLTTLPLSHAYARTCDFGTWLISGSTLALSLGHRGWESLVEQVRPTHANVVPALAERLLEDVRGQDRLRLLGCGGAPLSEDRFERFRKRGVTVIQGYGLTETSPVVCSATPADARPGWVGRPVSGWEVDLRGGRLFVRGPHVMLGYWNDPAATSQRVDPEGWLDTGDLVERDEARGELRIIGRADEILVLPNGNKLHPRRVEAHVEELSEVAHAMLWLDGDELELWFDQSVKEMVPTTSEYVRERIAARLAELPRWMRPARVLEFSPALTRDRGELNAKGALRRESIVKNRFGDRAESSADRAESSADQAGS